MATKDELFKKANQLNNAERSQEVIDLLDDKILMKFNSAKLYAEKARACSRLGKYDDCLKFSEQSISIDPNYPIPYNCRGNVWMFEKKYDKALEDYNKAIELKPDYSFPYQNRGSLWFYKKEYDKAIKDLSKAIDLNPEYADAYYNRASAWVNRGEFEKALADLNKAIQFKPKDADNYRNRAGIRFYKKEYAKAITDFNKVVELNPSDPQSYIGRGAIWSKWKEYEKALEDYEKAYKIRPSIELKTLIDEVKAKSKKIDEIKIEGNKTGETTLYFLVNTINCLNISSTDKKLLKDVGNTFLQTINNIRDYSFADNKDPVVHYTKLKVADKIINQEIEPLFRYYNVVYMNDPEEGEIIFDCLNDQGIKNCFKAGMGVQDNNVYLGSFLPAKEEDKKNNHEDELVMWRTYGKDENRNEAAGCSIVIMPDFFGKDKNYLHSEMYEKGPDDKGKIKAVSNQSLYSVLYFDKRDGKVIDSSLNNLINDLKSATSSFIGLKKTSTASEEKNLAIDKIVYRFLTEIRYLFKSADYAFENELRVIQYVSPQPNEKENLIKVDDNDRQWLPRRLYIESNTPIRPYISKIYLGPKVSNPQTWMYLETVMKLKGYTKMELKRSECKFQ